jgi:hypothetical protein
MRGVVRIAPVAISDYQESSRYEDSPRKVPGPPLLGR